MLTASTPEKKKSSFYTSCRSVNLCEHLWLSLIMRQIGKSPMRETVFYSYAPIEELFFLRWGKIRPFRLNFTLLEMYVITTVSVACYHNPTAVTLFCATCHLSGYVSVGQRL